MRHRCKVPKLSMKSDRRRAVLSGQAKDLILHGKVDTTPARAKATQALVERLVTWARKGDQAAQRRAFSVLLQSKEATAKLFSDLGPRYRDRDGGYTRVLKLGPRRGDGAEMARLTWV
ncbi:MAG: 50S ribosomal protein L17 [Candidatus Bipolaricaulota bacterium]